MSNMAITAEDLVPDDINELIALRNKLRADPGANIIRPMTEPNPGSDAAIALGCVCAVLDNNHGAGFDGLFWINADCYLHNTVSNYTDMNFEQETNARDKD